MHLNFIPTFTKWLELHFDHSYLILLVVIPFVSAVGMFLFGWFSIMRAYSIYYGADLPLTYWERRTMVSIFTVSGEVSVPPNLSDDQKTALKYMPSLKIASTRMMFGVVAIFALFAFTGVLLLFGVLK